MTVIKKIEGRYWARVYTQNMAGCDRAWFDTLAEAEAWAAEVVLRHKRIRRA